MKIEISNKSLIISIIAIIAIVASFIIGFYVGTPKEDDYSNIHFYNSAPSNEYPIITYHSDPNCFYLKDKVYLDCFSLNYEHSDGTNEVMPHNFCNYCMDTPKIEICEKRVKEYMGWN